MTICTKCFKVTSMSVICCTKLSKPAITLDSLHEVGFEDDPDDEAFVRIEIPTDTGYKTYLFLSKDSYTHPIALSTYDQNDESLVIPSTSKRLTTWDDLIECLKFFRVLMPDSEPRKPARESCTIPPTGWKCTRTHGHDGPCAAVQETQ